MSQLAPHVQPHTVLIVDDDPAVVVMLSRAIRQQGYHVFTAGNGLDALRCVKQHPIDLILSDVTMPTLDGVALCMRLRAEPAWSTIPIVIMSAADPQAFPPNLATHVLQKPLALDTLDRLLHALLPSRS